MTELSVQLEQVLSGEGKDDYARYMRTDVLLSLQKRPEEMIHRDELLWQTVHQSTELWLKLACFEVQGATDRIRDEHVREASRVLARASHAMRLMTETLEILTTMTPVDFQTITAGLGNGSGVQSPGWASVRRVSPPLGEAFRKLVAQRQTNLLAIYRGDPNHELYELAEAVLNWDDRINIWRARHFRVVLRIRGDGTSGTGGVQVSTLEKHVHRKFYPDLWEVRNAIALGAPVND